MHSSEVSIAGSNMSARPAIDWLRSEAGDSRATAALCAVDEALAAGGWRSRAGGAATRPDMAQTVVRVDLALHPAERNIGAAVAERVAATHPSWQVKADGDQLAIEGEITGSPGALLLPALQLDADGPWTQYLHAPVTLGLAIVGSGAGDVLHGVLADLVCMYPPTKLALTVFTPPHAELYRAAPQWVEPPGNSPALIEQLAGSISVEQAGTNLRPLLLAAIEPGDELLSTLPALLRRLGMLRSPPVALLIAAERPSSPFRALAAALPELSLRSGAQPGDAELRLAERRVAGQPPRFGADDMRELLHWLPRFGAAPPPCLWDSMSDPDRSQEHRGHPGNSLPDGSFDGGSVLGPQSAP